MADTESLLARNEHSHESDPSPNSRSPQPEHSNHFNHFGHPVDDQSQSRDVIWAVAFIASAAVVVLSAIINLVQGSACSHLPLFNICMPFTALLALALCCFASTFFGFAWVTIMSKPQFSSNIIGFCTAVNILVWSAIGLVFSAHDVWYPSIIAVFCGTAFGTLYLSMRNRLDFTSVLLEIAFDCHKSDLLLRTVLVAQFATILYTLIWMLAFGGSSSPLFILFMLINLSWAANILISIVYIVSGRVLASWYFNTHPRFVLDSVRASKTGFGSICFGSLSIALAQTLRILAQGSQQSGAPGSCLATCIFGALEYLTNCGSRFAFSYVAVWKVDFCSALERATTLLRLRTMDAFINYNFASVVVCASASIGGLVGSFWGSIFYILLGGHSYIVQVVGISYSIGFALTLLAVTTLESMVDTLMVLWAEVPDALIANHPSEHQRVVEALRKIGVFTGRDSNV